mgnify:CR=1 FL=1
MNYSSDNAFREQPSPTIQSVARALSIVDCVARNNYQLGLTEIAKRLNLNKATVYGLLNTLEQFQYVVLSPDTKKYHLGIRLLELGLLVENSYDIRRESKPFVDFLAGKYPCSAQVGVEINGKVTYLLVSASSEYALPAVCYVGLSAPCYCTGTGKAIIAQWSSNQLQAYLDHNSLLPRTSHTICSKEKLLDELTQIRTQGYAVDNEENQVGVISFSSPVFGVHGDVVAAIGLGILSAKLPENSQAEIIDDIKRCSMELSRRLGYK